LRFVFLVFLFYTLQAFPIFGFSPELSRHDLKRLTAMVPDSLDCHFSFYMMPTVREPLGRDLGAKAQHVHIAPASVQKLLTVSSALAAGFGPLRFVTRVHYDPSNLVQGRLEGPMVLVAGGDPYLQESDFQTFAKTLYADGIRHLAGPLIVDASRFDPLPAGPGWMWDDGPGSWAARVRACNVNSNANPSGIVQAPDSLFCALWTEHLQSQFQVDSLARLGSFEDLACSDSRFYRHFSPCISDLADSLLESSWNLGAECLFQESAFLQGKSGWAGGAATVQQSMREHFGLEGWWRSVDGSGMSRYNAISCRQVTQLLVQADAELSRALWTYLSLPGEGRLKGMQVQIPAGFELRAKTGTLTGRHLIAGYFLQEGHARAAFCLSLSGQAGGSKSVCELRDQILSYWANHLNRKF
jgi:D-alanyl-D-alanine carboxypeptidase